MHWFVGDLQGCAAEFETLLNRIRFDRARDELWCVGDLINRGPDSLATLELWEDAGGRAVLGNHEVYALCARSGRWPRKKDKLQPLYASPNADEWLAKLRALPVLVFVPGSSSEVRDVWVVHGGLHPGWTDLDAAASRINGGEHDDDWLESDDVSFATRVRACTAAGERSRFTGTPADLPSEYRPWDSYYPGDALVVHGHWASRGYYRQGNVIGLDSGCVYGGPLTAWCQEEDRIVQVSSQRRSPPH